MAYADPWEYNSYDGLTFSSAADAASWQNFAAAPAVNYANSGGGYNWGGITQGLFGLADTWLKADTAVKLQQNAYGQRYLEGEALRLSANGGLTIPPGLLLLGGIAAFVMLAK